MKVFDVILKENLGNLTQLNAGKLINLLKQHGGGIEKRFTRGSHVAGYSSQIIDAGVMKKGIANLRKAYRDNDPEGAAITGFCIYINNVAVAFGIFSAYDLAGRTREGDFAYDLTPFQDQLQAMADEVNATRTAGQRQLPPMNPTNAWEREGYMSWSDREAGKTPPVTHYIGKSTSVDNLSVLLEKFVELANRLGTTVTMKLFTNDKEGQERHNDRWRNASSSDKPESLMQRLAKYKNSKRPTADTIERFIEMVMNKEAAVINFEGRPYRVTQGGYGTSTMSAVDLLAGKPFKVSYDSANPNDYSDVDVSFRFNAKSNQIVPWLAEYKNEAGESVIRPMDLEFWMKTAWKVRDINSKEQVMRAFLSYFKDHSESQSQLKKLKIAIDAMKEAGHNWPEFQILEKNIANAKGY